MMNQKAFTMVELLAMLVVIGVLMAIAVPNIAGIIKNNRESIGIEDVNKMVGTAKQKFQTKKVKYPTEKDECVILTLKYLDDSGDYSAGPNGGVYDKDHTYIVVRKAQKTDPPDITYEYKYYVRIVEKKGDKIYQTDIQEYDNLDKLLFQKGNESTIEAEGIEKIKTKAKNECDCKIPSGKEMEVYQ